ncbi:hypothetical protein DKM19_27710 [Streptosporangium sp. 'caverna']|nr:hypothetical protein DKM19_27710 [Streptosporangium sp. 'caverna']
MKPWPDRPAGRLDRSWHPPAPPPFTSIAWRLSHLSELPALRADHTIGTHRAEVAGRAICP